MIYIFCKEGIEFCLDLGQFLQLYLFLTSDHIFHALEVLFLDHDFKVLCVSFLADPLEAYFFELMLIGQDLPSFDALNLKASVLTTRVYASL